MPRGDDAELKVFFDLDGWPCSRGNLRSVVEPIFKFVQENGFKARDLQAYTVHYVSSDS